MHRLKKLLTGVMMMTLLTLLTGCPLLPGKTYTIGDDPSLKAITGICAVKGGKGGERPLSYTAGVTEDGAYYLERVRDNGEEVKTVAIDEYDWEMIRSSVKGAVYTKQKKSAAAEDGALDTVRIFWPAAPKANYTVSEYGEYDFGQICQLMDDIFRQYEFDEIRPVTLSGIRSFELSEDVGSYVEGYYIYRAEKNADGTVTVTVKPVGKREEESLVRTEPADFMDKLLAVCEKYGVGGWNGFSRSDSGVLDGRSFRLSVIMTDGSSVGANGYMKYPDGFRSFREEIKALFEP